MSTFTGNADALGIKESQMEDAQDYELDNDDASEDVINTPTNVAPNEEMQLLAPTHQQVTFDVSETGGQGRDISKTSTTKLEHELKRIAWTDVLPKGARRALKLSSDQTPKNAGHPCEENEVADEEDSPMEVHLIYSTTLASDPGEPKSYKAAMNDPEREKWIIAIKTEIDNFYKRGVWKNSPGTNLMEGNLWEHVGYSKRSKNKIYQPDSKEELWSKAMSRFLESTSQTPLHLLPRILLCEPFLLSHYTMDTTNLKNAGFVKSSLWKQLSLKQIWMKISTLNGLREL